MNMLFIVIGVFICSCTLVVLARAVSDWNSIIQDLIFIVKANHLKNVKNRELIRAEKESIEVNNRNKINVKDLFTFSEDEIPTVDEFPPVENSEERQCLGIYDEVAE